MLYLKFQINEQIKKGIYEKNFWEKIYNNNWKC